MALALPAADTGSMAVSDKPGRGEGDLFSSDDDSIIMKQIQATHAPDRWDVGVRPVMHVVGDALLRAKPITITPQASAGLLEERVHQVDPIELHSYTIHRIASEMTYMSLGTGNDAHATALGILHQLSTFEWGAKVVLSMTAFAVNYGHFGLTVQLDPVNHLANNIPVLRQLPQLLERIDILKPRFDAANHLIKAMLDVTWCIVEFHDLRDEYLAAELKQEVLTYIRTAVYWTIRSIIACESLLTGLIGVDHDDISSTTEVWELSRLAHKLNTIHGHLTKKLDQCRRNIQERQYLEAYQALVSLFETPHIDNTKILRALLYSEEHPLIDGATRKRVGVEGLRRKIVMLLVSDLDISHEELFVLCQVYQDANWMGVDRLYELIWLPIVDRHHPWDDNKENKYNRLASVIPGHYPHKPTMIDPTVVQYVRRAWRFDKKPLLVVLDPQGKVVCHNAFPMMWIWGSLAYPFTRDRQEDLWKAETWRLELIVDEIDPAIIYALRDKKIVCLYGGDDINWIREFTTLLRSITREVHIPLEMVYVGKSNANDQIKRITLTIASERLSSYWHDSLMQWFFWLRLETMLHSKLQLHDKSLGITPSYSTIDPETPGPGAMIPAHSGHDGAEIPNGLENDQILLKVMSLLSYDSDGRPWAVISQDAEYPVMSEGRDLLECLRNFERWKIHVESEGFFNALRHDLENFHAHKYCTRLILMDDVSRIKEQVVCANCNKILKKFALYQCSNY